MACKQHQINDNGPCFPKIRNERIDAVKYWLIVLVIAGHVFARPQFDAIQGCTVIGKWIYLFHMPLFVFFSGYFTRKKNSKSFVSSIWKLAEPLLMCQTIVLLVKLIIKDDISIYNIFTPPFALWYLFSLICWRLIMQIIPDRFLCKSCFILSVSFCVGILAGFLPFGRLLSVQRTLSFMPFFFFGYCMKEKNLFLSDKYRPLCLAFLILSFAIPLFFQQYLGSLEHADPYSSIDGMYSRILVFCLCIPISLSFINICPNTSWAARQGRLTMQYYVYHALIIRPFVTTLWMLNLTMSFWTAVFCSAVVTVGLGVASYFPYFSKLTNPSSIIKELHHMN